MPSTSTRFVPKGGLQVLQPAEVEHDYDHIAADPVLQLIEPAKAWVIDRQPKGFEVLVSPVLGCIDRDFATNLPPGFNSEAAAAEILRLESLSDGEILQMVREQLVGSEVNAQLRVYRTAAGLRLLVESQPLSPNGAIYQLLHRSLQGDEIYAAVCAQCQVFAMRTTGKPERLQKLEGQPYAVCRYLGTVGRAGVSEEVAHLIAAHDELTRALEEGLPLA